MIDILPYNTTMNLPRFFCPQPLSANTRIDLPENAARHACRVLRLRAGDGLVLFDGCGGDYSARIAEVARERVSVDLLEWRNVEREAPISITLVQALQSGEKMDLTVQKAVELGVQRIVPVTSRRGVVRLEGERALRRVEHWRGVVVSACEQSGRNRVPEVSSLESLERWLGKPVGVRVRRLMLAPGAETTLDRIEPLAAGEQIELLIGAEGGLAPDEMEKAALAGFVSVRLGPRILRTETAGLAALAVIQCLWGDFREGGDHV
jgi:16S rRNA (uracil1498-N3)-methyltransferase